MAGFLLDDQVFHQENKQEERLEKPEKSTRYCK